jgi:ribosomal protein L35AE/L33A
VAGVQRFHDVVFVSREDDADGHLAVVGAVGGVEGAAAVVEANFSTDLLAQSFG